jgi:hypothetical protein
VHGIWNFIAIQYLKVKFNNKNYEIDVTASVNAYYSELATAMKDGGYVLAEVNSTGTKNGSSNSTTNCYRRDGNKYYLNSSIRYR